MAILGIFFVLLVICFMAFTIYLYVNYPYLLEGIILSWMCFYILYVGFKNDTE
jgi:hypothetical protein